jgi:hypothetical protein
VMTALLGFTGNITVHNIPAGGTNERAGNNQSTRQPLLRRQKKSRN